ncbi:MAG: twin-arginine translocase TatA/TatE family subunit [Bacteroidota bacterium]
MFDVGAGEMIFILIAALMLFGPKKIPEVAQMLGKGLREFRRAQDGLRAQIREVTADIDDPFSDKPVAPRPFKIAEPVVVEHLHEPEAPGQISLLDNPPQENPTEPEPVLKPVIQPAQGNVARPGRPSSSPTETASE